MKKQRKVMEERFKALDKSIWDSVKEEQVKLGYRKEVIRLYYPIESVERLLHIIGNKPKNSNNLKSDTNIDGISEQLPSDNTCARVDCKEDEYSADIEQKLHAALADFISAEQDTLGSIGVSNDGERYCIKLPEEASEYIHEHTPHSGFLYDFIDVIARHGISIEDVLNVFRKYSDKLHIEELIDDDFDYLVYFEDGVPDDYRYCLTDEGHHIIYHRFTPEDYDALGS